MIEDNMIKEACVESFEKSVRSIGLYRSKAKHIRATSQILAQN